MSDERAMARALELAWGAVGTTAPNPTVGAVLVRDLMVIGEGYTLPVGGAHAEIEALRDAARRGHDPAGSTMYVTLEPCCHHGRTPPCTDALLAAGVSRVVVGLVDPYPQVRGRGLAQLRDAGVAVELGLMERACAEVVRGFARAQEHGLPEVSCKVAMSLDGHIATASGESQWITGEPAREHGQGLRATHDAILVGIGTVLADDPRLTCRVDGGTDPVPVVLDTELRTPSDAALLSAGARALILCADDAPDRELDADVMRLPRGPGGVDITLALRLLAARGLHRVLVEGGGHVHRSLLDAALVDTLHITVGGLTLPGGQSWLAGPALESLGAARRFGRPKVQAVGDDVLLTYGLVHQTEGS